MIKNYFINNNDEFSYSFFKSDLVNILAPDPESIKEMEVIFSKSKYRESIFKKKFDMDSNIVSTLSTACTITEKMKSSFFAKKMLDGLEENFLTEYIVESISNATFFLEEERSGKNIIYVNSKKPGETEPVLTYISINLLIKKILLENFYSQNKALVKAFTEQHFLFIEVDILIHKMLSAFEALSGTKEFSKNDFFTFLRMIVIENYPEVKKNDVLMKLLIKFIKSNASDPEIKANSSYIELNNLFDNMKYIFDEEFNLNALKRINLRTSAYISTFFFVSPKDKEYFDIFKWDVESVAKELSFISFKMLSKIAPKELLSKNKELNSNNIHAAVTRFDKLILFIIEDVYAYDAEEVRAQCIEKWAKIAIQCRKYHNLNDCLIITSAFSHFLLRRLKKTWQKVSKESMDEINDLKSFCDLSNGYARLKEDIEKCLEEDDVYIPYLGMVLKEIINLNEKLRYIKDKFLINFDKIRRVSESLNRFFLFQNQAFKFRPIDARNIFFEQIDPKPEEELEKLGDKLEPKFTLRKKDIRHKRPTNTDLKVFSGIQ